jgi:hypothetical protein
MKFNLHMENQKIRATARASSITHSCRFTGKILQHRTLFFE